MLAHNLIRWTTTLGGIANEQFVVARTVRTRLLAIPARLVNRAGQATLRLPARWPWAASFTTALANLRLIGPAPG